MRGKLGVRGAGRGEEITNEMVGRKLYGKRNGLSASLLSP